MFGSYFLILFLQIDFKNIEIFFKLFLLSEFNVCFVLCVFF